MSEHIDNKMMQLSCILFGLKYQTKLSPALSSPSHTPTMHLDHQGRTEKLQPLTKYGGRGVDVKEERAFEGWQ